MSIDYYITPEEYEVAEKNGISRQTLEHRVRGALWEKDVAITKKPKYNNRKKWAVIAVENGISYQTFLSRVNDYGMSEEEAATRPLQNRRSAMRKINDMRKEGLL